MEIQKDRELKNIIKKTEMSLNGVHFSSRPNRNLKFRYKNYDVTVHLSVDGDWSHDEPSTYLFCINKDGVEVKNFTISDYVSTTYYDYIRRNMVDTITIRDKINAKVISIVNRACKGRPLEETYGWNIRMCIETQTDLKERINNPEPYKEKRYSDTESNYSYQLISQYVLEIEEIVTLFIKDYDFQGYKRAELAKVLALNNPR